MIRPEALRLNSQVGVIPVWEQKFNVRSLSIGCYPQATYYTACRHLSPCRTHRFGVISHCLFLDYWKPGCRFLGREPRHLSFFTAACWSLSDSCLESSQYLKYLTESISTFYILYMFGFLFSPLFDFILAYSVTQILSHQQHYVRGEKILIYVESL